MNFEHEAVDTLAFICAVGVLPHPDRDRVVVFSLVDTLSCVKRCRYRIHTGYNIMHDTRWHPELLFIESGGKVT